jgi:hypothetical protein
VQICHIIIPLIVLHDSCVQSGPGFVMSLDQDGQTGNGFHAERGFLSRDRVSRVRVSRPERIASTDSLSEFHCQ